MSLCLSPVAKQGWLSSITSLPGSWFSRAYSRASRACAAWQDAPPTLPVLRQGPQSSSAGVSPPQGYGPCAGWTWPPSLAAGTTDGLYEIPLVANPLEYCPQFKAIKKYIESIWIWKVFWLQLCRKSSSRLISLWFSTSLHLSDDSLHTKS